MADEDVCGHDHEVLWSWLQPWISMVVIINFQGHNFLIRTLNLVFLVSLEISGIVESIYINLDAI